MQLVQRLISDAFPPSTDVRGNYFKLSVASADIEGDSLRSVLTAAGADSFETLAPRWRHLEGESFVDRHGNAVDLVDFTDVYRVHLGGPARVADARQLLRVTPGVETVEFDTYTSLFCTQTDSITTDTLSCKQWHLNNVGQEGIETGPCTMDLDINAPEAWAIWDSAGTKLGISDSGIRSDHEDLIGACDSTLSHNWTGSSPFTGAGHGTGVAGVAAAVGNNVTGIAGVANLQANRQDKLLVSLKIFGGGPDGSGGNLEPNGALALDWTVAHYPSILVVNQSWGKPHYQFCNTVQSALRDACRNAYLAGICLVAAAGNGGPCADLAPCERPGPCFPVPAAFDDYVLAVSGVNCEGGDAWPGQDAGSYIDVTAPGGGLLTLNPPGGYIRQSGTSEASPAVAAVASLMIGLEPNLTNDDVYNLLRLTAVPIPGRGTLRDGFGLVRADAALAELAYPRQLRWGETEEYVATLVDSSNVEVQNVDGFSTATDVWEPAWVEVYELRSVVNPARNAGESVRQFWTRGRTSSGWRRLDTLPEKRYDARWFGNYVMLDRWDGSATLVSYTYKFYREHGGTPIGWLPFDPEGGDPYRACYGYTVQMDGAADVGTGAERRTPVTVMTDAIWRSGVPNHLQLVVRYPGLVSVKVYDISGRNVSTLWDAEDAAVGRHLIDWSAKNDRGRRLPGGVYFVRLSMKSTYAGGYCDSRRIIVLP